MPGSASDAVPFPQLGVWRSLVARSVRVGEVPSSNLGTPMEYGGTPGSPVGPLLATAVEVLGCQEPSNARCCTTVSGVVCLPAGGAGLRRCHRGAPRCVYGRSLCTRLRRS